MVKHINKIRLYLSNFSIAIRNSAIGLAGFCLIVVNMNGLDNTPFEMYAHTIGAVATAVAGYKILKTKKIK